MDETNTDFHGPPGWPPLPEEFVPGRDWRKPDHWGAAPAGWNFYTRNGQPTAPPRDAWQPQPTDFAASSATASPAQAPAAAMPSSSLPATAPTGPTANPSRDSTAGQVGRGSGRGRLVAVVAGAVVVVVLAVVGVHLFRAHAAAQAVAPLTHEQLVSALNPSDNKTVVGLKLTQIDELAPSGVFSGYVCEDQILPFFAGADGTVVESRDSGGGIDPNTQTVVGGGLSIDAGLLTTTNEAQASFGPTSFAVSDCLTERVQATPGPSGDNYRSAVQQGKTFVFLTHRNVVAIMRFDTYSDPIDVQKAVDDVDELLDDAR